MVGIKTFDAIRQERVEAGEKKRAETLKKINIYIRETGDLLMMGCGAFTPLEGFMTKADWKGVCDEFKMANGLFWPIPITVSTDDEAVKEGDEIALVNSGEWLEMSATMKVTEKYTIDKAYESEESLHYR